jgi:tetratricopeptide (TPR) repeat protein
MWRTPWPSDGAPALALAATSGLAAGLILLACVAGLVVGVLVGRRRPPEDARRRAAAASLLDDHAEAISWLRVARRRSPHDADLVIEEAWHLAALGRVDDALRLYDEVAALLPPGQAAWLKAVALLERGRGADEIEPLVVAALAASPIFAEEALLEPDLLRRLEGRPAFRKALDEAMARRGRG